MSTSRNAGERQTNATRFACSNLPSPVSVLGCGRWPCSNHPEPIACLPLPNGRLSEHGAVVRQSIGPSLS